MCTTRVFLYTNLQQQRHIATREKKEQQVVYHNNRNVLISMQKLESKLPFPLATPTKCNEGSILRVKLKYVKYSLVICLYFTYR